MARVSLDVSRRCADLEDDSNIPRPSSPLGELITPQNDSVSNFIAMLMQHARFLEEKRRDQVSRRLARNTALIGGYNAIYETERDKQNALVLRAHREQLRRAKSEVVCGSADEIYERIWELVDEGKHIQAETETQRLRRLKGVNAKIMRLWKVNNKVVEGAQPRYVDGVPVRTMMRPPTVVEATRRFVSTGLEACFACSARKMRCSWERSIEGQEAVDGWGKKACSRCSRNGEACLVGKPGRELDETDGRLLEIAADGRLVVVDAGCFAPVMPYVGLFD